MFTPLKIARPICIALVLALSSPILPQDHERRIYLCSSPLIAFNFWNAILDLQKQGIKLTPEIARQLCDGMKEGTDPKCIYVQMTKFKPIASGWGGALALTDEKTKVWFHHPDGDGWVHPDYYVYLMNTDH